MNTLYKVANYYTFPGVLLIIISAGLIATISKDLGDLMLIIAAIAVILWFVAMWYIVTRNTI